MAAESQDWDERKSKKYVFAPNLTDHKYSRGVITCITGSNRFSGAALLNTEAALATGVGMVGYCGPQKVQKLVLLNRPEIVINPRRTDIYLIGSGVSENPTPTQKIRMRAALKSKLPIILDAGALQLVTKSDRDLNQLTLLTPHVGELAKLFNYVGTAVTANQIELDPQTWAQKAARTFHATVLLKGNTTCVANADRIITLPAATTRLATAGTGDVLAGIIGGLFAINHLQLTSENLIEVAATAALVHALAAKKQVASENGGPLNLHKMMALIPKVLTEI